MATPSTSPVATVFGTGKQEQIAGWIGGDILNGRAAPGSQLPTVEAVRARFGVAVGTVQLALDRLRQAGLIESTRGGGIYVAERPPCLDRVALVFSSHPGDARWSRFHDALSGATTQPHGTGMGHAVTYDLYGDSGDKTLGRATRTALSARLAACHYGGVIMGDASFSIGTLPFRQSWGIPAVAIMGGPSANEPNLPTVYPDFAAFFRAALQRLHERGQRRPAVIVSARPSYLTGLDAALRDLPTDIARPADWGTLLVPMDRPESAASVAALLLRLPVGERPDALVVVDDYLRQPVFVALASGGWDPATLDVVSFCSFPALAAAVPEEIRLGYRATDVLHACIEQLAMQRSGMAARPFVGVAPRFEGELD